MADQSTSMHRWRAPVAAIPASSAPKVGPCLPPSTPPSLKPARSPAGVRAGGGPEHVGLATDRGAALGTGDDGAVSERPTTTTITPTTTLTASASAAAHPIRSRMAAERRSSAIGIVRAGERGEYPSDGSAEKGAGG